VSTATILSLPTPLPGMSTSDLESELLGLAGHIAAAECRFLQLLAEFDDRAGWAGDGIHSCAHWLSWRAGMSLRTATERLRVAHALQNLPKIAEAFGAGGYGSRPRVSRRGAAPSVGAPYPTRADETVTVGCHTTGRGPVSRLAIPAVSGEVGRSVP